MNRAADIVYDEAGPANGAGEPILCLHGIGGNTDSFGPQLEGLCDTHRILSWAMPGYGGSAPLGETTFETLSAAAIRLMDGLKIGTAHLAGQSIGGMIAQDMALRYPDRIASLILIGTTPSFGGRDDTFKTEFLKARLKPLDAGLTMPELAERFVPDIVGPIADETAIASATRSMAAVPVETYRTIMRCLVTFNRRDDLADISQPCCLIAGSHDKNAPPRTMEKMATRLPDAVYHLIDGAGHLINLEAPDACNALIRDFLTSIEERP